MSQPHLNPDIRFYASCVIIGAVGVASVLGLGSGMLLFLILIAVGAGGLIVTWLEKPRIDRDCDAE